MVVGERERCRWGAEVDHDLDAVAVPYFAVDAALVHRQRRVRDVEAGVETRRIPGDARGRAVVGPGGRQRVGEIDVRRARERGQRAVERERCGCELDGIDRPEHALAQRHDAPPRGLRETAEPRPVRRFRRASGGVDVVAGDVDAEPQPGARGNAQARPGEGHLDVVPGRGPHAPVGRVRRPRPIPRAGGGAAFVGEIAVGIDQEMKGAGADRGRRARGGVDHQLHGVAIPELAVATALVDHDARVRHREGRVQIRGVPRQTDGDGVVRSDRRRIEHDRRRTGPFPECAVRRHGGVHRGLEYRPGWGATLELQDALRELRARAQQLRNSGARRAVRDVGARVWKHAPRHGVRERGIGGRHQAQVLVVLHAVADDRQAEARHRDARRPTDVRDRPRIEKVSVAGAAEAALAGERRREEPDRVVVELALHPEEVRQPLHRPVLHSARVDDVVGLPAAPV